MSKCGGKGINPRISANSKMSCIEISGVNLVHILGEGVSLSYRRASTNIARGQAPLGGPSGLSAQDR